MRFNFWKKKLLLSPTVKKKEDKMSIRITIDTVQSANERLKREGNRFYNTTPIAANGTFNVSVKFRGNIISQSISSEKIKSDYEKSLKAICNVEKL